MAHDYQDTSYYCVPAAAKAMIGGVASQSYLASHMSTTSTGTQFSRVPGAINPFTPHNYVYTSGSSSFTSSSDLFSHVKYNLAYQGAYLMFAVESDALTYVPVGYSGYHALVGQGWSGSSVSIWDPEYQTYNTSTGGVHLQSPSTLYSAELVHGRELVW